MNRTTHWFYVVWIIFFVGKLSFAAQKDSARVILTEDRNKILLLLEQSEQLQDSSPDESLKYITQAIELADLKALPDLYTQGQKRLAEYFRSQKRITEAINVLEELKKYHPVEEDLKGRLDIYMTLGEIYSELSLYTAAAVQFAGVHRILRNEEHKHIFSNQKKAELYLRIGRIYIKMGDYGIASKDLQVANACLSDSTNTLDLELKMNILLLLGEAQERLGQWKEARETYFELAQLDGKTTFGYSYHWILLGLVQNHGEDDKGGYDGCEMANDIMGDRPIEELKDLFSLCEARTAFRNNRLKKAAQHLEDITHRNFPDTRFEKEYWLLSALVASRQGNFTRADSSLIRAEMIEQKRIAKVIKELAHKPAEYFTQQQNIIRYQIDRAESIEKEKISATWSYSSLNLLLWGIAILSAVVVVWAGNRVRLRNERDKYFTTAIEQQTQDLAQSNEKLHAANEELKYFAYMTSHDMKEPVRNILSTMSLLSRRLKNVNDPSIDRYMDLVQTNSKRMFELVSAVFDFTSLREGNVPFASVDSNKTAQEVVHVMKDFLEEYNGKVELQELPRIETNQSYLGVLFKQLIENGIKFNNSLTPKVVISYKSTPGYNEFHIVDNGIGIDPKYYEYIFKPFNRLHEKDKFPGNGLGLAICRKIMENLKGNIVIRSKEGEGTRFILQLPIHQNS